MANGTIYNDTYERYRYDLVCNILDLLGRSSSAYYNNGAVINGRALDFTRKVEDALLLIHSTEVFWKISYEYSGETGCEHHVVRIVDADNNVISMQSGEGNGHSIAMLMSLAYHDYLELKGKDKQHDRQNVWCARN